MKKSYIFIIVAVLVLAGFLLLLQKSSVNSGSSTNSSLILVQDTQNPKNTTPTGNQNTRPGINLKELSSHNSASDCWVVFNGKVYDITNYISSHPGGISSISAACGDSKLFENYLNSQHGSKYDSQMSQIGKFMGNFTSG
jgi:cytochrome b involved in lipid metabolism